MSTNKRNLKQWAIVYRGLGNPNRLRILKILSKTKEMSVSELSEELGITLKNTSRNLNILSNLNLVEFQGRRDRVYYKLNFKMESEIRRILGITFG